METVTFLLPADVADGVASDMAVEGGRLASHDPLVDHGLDVGRAHDVQEGLVVQSADAVDGVARVEAAVVLRERRDVDVAEHAVSSDAVADGDAFARGQRRPVQRP